MDDIKGVAQSSIDYYLDHVRVIDRVALKTKLKEDLSKYIYSKTKRRPMILPIIMDA